jgi:hypothetical protein
MSSDRPEVTWQAHALELSAYCEGLRVQLEQAIPELRLRLLAVERAVPIEVLREMVVMPEPEYPFSLRGIMDVFLRVSLPSVIGELHAFVTASEEHPFGLPLDEEELWQRLDPAAGEVMG